jgi:hypothetical protein
MHASLDQPIRINTFLTAGEAAAAEKPRDRTAKENIFIFIYEFSRKVILHSQN